MKTSKLLWLALLSSFAGCSSGRWDAVPVRRTEGDVGVKLAGSGGGAEAAGSPGIGPGFSASPAFALDEPTWIKSKWAVSSRVACLPTQCLVSWNEGSSEGRVTRITYEGELIDPKPLRIESGMARVLAAGATEYLLAGGLWVSTLSAGADGPSPPLPLPVGNVLDAAALGDRFVMVGWRAVGGGGQELVAARIEAGVVLDGDSSSGGIILDTNTFSDVRVAAGGGVALVVWANQFARLNMQTGQVLEPTPITISKYDSVAGRPFDVTFDGANFLIAWSAGFSLKGVRVRAFDGEILDKDDDQAHASGAVEMATSAPGEGSFEHPLNALFDGTRYVVLSADPYDGPARVRASVVDTGTLEAIAPPEFTVHDYGPSPWANRAETYAVAWSGQRGLFVTETVSADTTEDGLDARSLQLSPQGLVVGEPFKPALRANWQTNSVVASNGDGFLVAWQDDQASNESHFPGVRAVRLSNDGTVLLPGVFWLWTPTPQVGGLNAASDGKDYLVTSGNSARRVRASDGALLDGDASQPGLPLPKNTGNYGIEAVASDGERYLLARRQDLPGLSTHVVVTVLDAASGDVVGEATLGEVSGDSGGIVAAGETASAPGERTFLVAWDAQTSTRVLGCRVQGATSEPLDPVSQLSLKADLPAVSRSPAVSFGGSSFYLTWTRHASEVGLYSVRGASISLSDGLPLDAGGDGKGTLISNGERHNLALSFDGRSFVSLFRDESDVAGSMHLVWRAARVSPGGEALDVPSALVVETLGLGGLIGSGLRPAIASAKNGRSLVVHASAVTDEHMAAPRVQAHLLVNELGPGSQGGGAEAGGAAGAGGFSGNDAGAAGSAARAQAGGAGGEGGAGGAGSAGAFAGKAGASLGGVAGAAAAGGAGRAAPGELLLEGGGCGCRGAGGRGGDEVSLALAALALASLRKRRWHQAAAPYGSGAPGASG